MKHPLALLFVLTLLSSGSVPGCRDWDQREIEIDADTLCQETAERVENQASVWTQLVKPCVSGNALDADCARDLAAGTISDEAFETSRTACTPTVDQSPAEQKELEERCLLHEGKACSLCLTRSAVDAVDWVALWSLQCGTPGCRECLANLDCAGDGSCDTAESFNDCSDECFLGAFACGKEDDYLVLPESQKCDLVVDCPNAGQDELTEGGGEACDVTCRELAGLSDSLALTNPNALVSSADLCSAGVSWVGEFISTDLRTARGTQAIQFESETDTPFCLDAVSYRIDDGAPVSLSGAPIGSCEEEPEIPLPELLNLQGHTFHVEVVLVEPWVQFDEPRLVSLSVGSGEDPTVALVPPESERTCPLEATSSALDEVGCLACAGGTALVNLFAEGRSHRLVGCDCTEWEEAGELLQLPLACDGIVNCDSGVDEAPELCCEENCDCENALNVRSDLICNGVENCAGGEDESVCASQCELEYLGDGYCDAENNVETCAWDLGDCCQSDCQDGGSNCGENGYCCRDPQSYDFDPDLVCDAVCQDGWIGDAICDPQNNVADCDYDGGDCCESDCRSSMEHSCGGEGYCCLNPDSSDFAPSACWQ